MTKNRPPRDLPASVRQRLLNQARDTNRPFNEFLQRYAMERFLFRLGASKHARKFVLKGALLFTAWGAPMSRPTMDIDLLGKTKNTIEAVTGAIAEICETTVEADGLVFGADSLRAERIAEDANYEGIRVRFIGHLGTARVNMQLDIGFGDVVVPRVQQVKYPTILNMPEPHLRCYSRETTVAEKYEAMAKLGILNSRMKDFYDIWLLSRLYEFDGAVLAKAISETFAHRGTLIEPEPIALKDEFTADTTKQIQWQAFATKGVMEDVPGKLLEIIGSVRTFLGPVAKALAAGRPFQETWRAPGPWSGGT